MENVRVIIAIALSFLVFMIWGLFFNPPSKAPRREEQPQKDTVAVSQEAVNTESEKDSQGQTSVASSERQELENIQKSQESAGKARTISIDTPLYHVVFDEKGAVIKHFILKKFREGIEQNSPPLDMVSAKLQSGVLGMGFDGPQGQDLSAELFSADVESKAISLEKEEKTISFSWVSSGGTAIVKAFTIDPKSYVIGLGVKILNGGGQKIQEKAYIEMESQLASSKNAYGYVGPLVLADGKISQMKVKKVGEGETHTGKIQWMAVEDRYFISAIIAEDKPETSVTVSLQQDDTVRGRYVIPGSDLARDSMKSLKFKLFFGPKSIRVLRAVGYDLEKSIDFGWFEFIAKPGVEVMNFLYGFIPNYGIVIIILTIFIKILLWPLGNKSYKSMAEMKKIQPLMTEIREKYKDDKKKMNEEVMKLYRIYKINPLGGCLPMIVQIPVFIAFYRMLYGAIELRHAPFIGWINDLSAPDRLFHFSFSVPFMQPPYGIPVLTVIMGATMFLQQKMSPPMGDPSQAKMMMLMPIVFTVIFINFPSGLVLYWLVNNILSIGQQYYVTQKKA